MFSHHQEEALHTGLLREEVALDQEPVPTRPLTPSHFCIRIRSILPRCSSNQPNHCGKHNLHPSRHGYRQPRPLIRSNLWRISPGKQCHHNRGQHHRPLAVLPQSTSPHRNPINQFRTTRSIRALWVNPIQPRIYCRKRPRKFHKLWAHQSRRLPPQNLQYRNCL